VMCDVHDVHDMHDVRDVHEGTSVSLRDKLVPRVTGTSPMTCVMCVMCGCVGVWGGVGV
jgi:hypothetical protein